jgi:hypothetical protein
MCHRRHQRHFGVDGRLPQCAQHGNPMMPIPHVILPADLQQLHRGQRLALPQRHGDARPAVPRARLQGAKCPIKVGAAPFAADDCVDRHVMESQMALLTVAVDPLTAVNRPLARATRPTTAPTLPAAAAARKPFLRPTVRLVIISGACRSLAIVSCAKFPCPNILILRFISYTYSHFIQRTLCVRCGNRCRKRCRRKVAPGGAMRSLPAPLRIRYNG